MRQFALIIVILSSLPCVFSQGNGDILFYCKPTYAPITDMSNIDVAVRSEGLVLALDDERKNESGEVVAWMRRYYDAVYDAHPSVLKNLNAPTHYVIVANEWSAVRNMFEAIGKYSTIGRKGTELVLLFGGAIDMQADSVRQITKMCDALYVGSDGSMAMIDRLTQAFWSGEEISRQGALFDASGLTANTQKKTRLAFATTLDENETKLSDSLTEVAKKAIDNNATPGLSVMVARKGRVIYNRQFGYTTYQETTPVGARIMYDIASLSKVVGTLPHVVRLFDQGKLDAKKTLKELLGVQGWQGKINVGQLLLHTSGLPAGIPMFALTVDSASFTPPLLVKKRKAGYQQKVGKNLYINETYKLRKGFFSETKDDVHTTQVGRSLYASDSLRFIIWRHIANIPQYSPTYRYSDINFLYLQRIVERMTGVGLDELFDATIARPLGLARMMYLPDRKYRLSEIAPTSDDTYFRKEMVWTTVHDETAACLGGVAGNAGLFATANEVLKIGQMYLQGGTYGGVRLFSQSTFDIFITRHDPHCRRGYGFDMPERRAGKVGPVPDCVPKTSFGHTGFTGTMLWIDPESETVFVFVSNRIHTSVDNTKLTSLDIRAKMLEALCK